MMCVLFLLTFNVNWLLKFLNQHVIRISDESTEMAFQVIIESARKIKNAGIVKEAIENFSKNQLYK